MEVYKITTFYPVKCSLPEWPPPIWIRLNMQLVCYGFSSHQILAYHLRYVVSKSKIEIISCICDGGALCKCKCKQY